jgi:hypothetical protein
MLISLGLLSFLAVLSRSASNVILKPCLLACQTLLFGRSNWLNIAISLVDIGKYRLLLPFSAVM